MTGEWKSVENERKAGWLTMEQAHGFNEKLNRIVTSVAAMEAVDAIGRSGDALFVPKPGEGDIDLFVYCGAVPSDAARMAAYEACGVEFERCDPRACDSDAWGTGDLLIIDGVETMFMYFTTAKTEAFLDEVLAGRRLDSVGGFYPSGRCAMLLGIHPLYDETVFLASAKSRLRVMPNELAGSMAAFHLERAYDAEDFSRAVLREDVLFYHQVLECAVDHFLQALFALNKTWFPSRKRTGQYIDGFAIKPENCFERLCEAIRLGAEAISIGASAECWRGLLDELDGLANKMIRADHAQGE
jgi:hypothetical protein